MENKYSITAIFALLIIITVITSTLTIYTLQKPFLKGPGQEGTVEITGGILPVVDVIIIDSSVVAGISDIIQFSGAVPGGTYSTDNIPSSSEPYPFVIRNNGNVRANIEIDERRSTTQLNLGLFDNTNSRLKYWAEPTFPITGAIGYSSLDNCIPLTSDCFTSSPCNIRPDPTDTSCVIPFASAGRILAISSLNYVDATDEAFLHILIHIDNAEPAGTKNTIITITGSQT